MNVLELPIPPLPQFVTGGIGHWPIGRRHFERTLKVYDVIIVFAGTLYLTENGIPYEVNAGEILVITPNLVSYGHRAVDTEVEIGWFHFLHPEPLRQLPLEDVAWQMPLPQANSLDTAPRQHVMYIPKYAAIDLTVLQPILERMIRTHLYVKVDSALELQTLLAEFLTQLQRMVSRQNVLPSQKVSALASEYIRQHMAQPFKADQMEEQLHYRYDYISRCFKRHIGMTPLEYVHHLRLEEAKRLLIGSAYTVGEISERIGMPDVNYFIKLFRRTVGMTPGKYRDAAFTWSDHI
ncbi:MAG: hypothetical protein K0Q59_5890 [Paenibacillus sp.]|jgi:AraC-like DNA-binding protein|nr:hypothetical protein [Paenibacillus sp.]